MITRDVTKVIAAPPKSASWGPKKSQKNSWIHVRNVFIFPCNRHPPANISRACALTACPHLSSIDRWLSSAPCHSRTVSHPKISSELGRGGSPKVRDRVNSPDA